MSYEILAQLYKLLAHPTRLAILDILRDGEQCVCHLEAVSGLRQAHISQHLMLLREASIVSDRRDGWNIFYRVVRPDIFIVIDAMNNITGATSNLTEALVPHKAHHCPCPKCNTPTPPQLLEEGLGEGLHKTPFLKGTFLDHC